MTKCSLFFVPFLVAIAVSDALQARAAGTLPRSATSVQDKATESTVSGKRALQSKEDTKGAADEERVLNGLQSRLESLSTKMKSTTDWMARTWKGASFSVSGVSQKGASFSVSGVSQKGASFSVSGVSQEDLEKAKAFVVELEDLQSELQKLNEDALTAMTRDREFSEPTRKVESWGITRLWPKLESHIKKVQKKKKDREWQKVILTGNANAAKLAELMTEAKKKVDDITAAIQVKSNTPLI